MPYATGQEEKWKNRVVPLYKKVVMVTNKNKSLTLLEGVVEFLEIKLGSNSR